MDLVTALPQGPTGNNAVMVFVNRLSKMTHIVSVHKSISAQDLGKVFFDIEMKHHGLREVIISDRAPQFTSDFWQALYIKAGTQLKLSTPAHPQSDGQSERGIGTTL